MTPSFFVAFTLCMKTLEFELPQNVKLRKNDQFCGIFHFRKKMTFLCSILPADDIFSLLQHFSVSFFPLLSFVKNATVLHYLSLPKITPITVLHFTQIIRQMAKNKDL
jgi:hypothetical protein